MSPRDRLVCDTYGDARVHTHCGHCVVSGIPCVSHEPRATSSDNNDSHTVESIQPEIVVGDILLESLLLRCESYNSKIKSTAS